MFKASVALLFALFWFAVLAWAQDKDNQDETIKLKSDLVMVTASAIDRSGNPLKALKAKDFIVYEDGAKQKIEHFTSTEEPFTLMLLLDVSGSTRDDIALIKRAAKNFLAELRDKDRVGVILFSGEVEMIADFKDSRTRVEQAIERLTSTPGEDGYQFSTRTGTSFYDALFLAVEESPFKEVEGRKAIVCVSDGVDSTSKLDYAEVARLVEKSEASVYFLELNTEEATLAGLLRDSKDPEQLNFSPAQLKRYFDEFDADSIERHKPRQLLSPETKKKINKGLYEIAHREMREIVERTGGREYAVRSLNDLAGVYKQVADDLRSQYSIGYYPTNDAHDGRWHKIRVELKKGGTVRARSGYWSPGK
ncbi:MAG: VWA domain-containing protein [Acidobacteria bacterium]|nr:VWA domain-containing protein [Acidobacteriota bacterium]